MTDGSTSDRTTDPRTASAPDPGLDSTPALGPVTASGAEPSAPRRALGLLAQRLTERGLHSSQLRDTLLLALNPAVRPEPGPRPLPGSPGLQQLVACLAMDGTEGLWFWWVWSIADDYTPLEYGPLCQASEIDRAAERIAHVLAVRDETATGDAAAATGGDGYAAQADRSSS